MRCVLVALLCMALPAATVDRLAIIVGYNTVTELQIDEDLRMAALFNGQQVSRDLESRRSAADRLVDQLLIQHEIEISRYPTPSQEELNSYYSRTEQTLGGPERLKELLEKYAISETTLRAHLLAQLSTLRFIKYRFSPDVDISDIEIEAAARKNGDPTLTLSQLDANQRAKITELLMEERTDEALSRWLAEGRKQVNIRYIDASLQ